MSPRRQSGFTIIELMVTVALIAIIAAIAMPSFKSLLENRKLIAAANSLQADFQFAKTEAIKRNKTVFVSFENVAATNWCYGLNESTFCDCTVANSCSIKAVNVGDLPAVTLQETAAADVSYDQFRGFTSSTGNFKFSLGGKSTGVNLEFNGRATICSDNGLGGFEACPP